MFINKSVFLTTISLLALFATQNTYADAQSPVEIAYLRFMGDCWQVWVTDSKGKTHRQLTFDKVDKTRVSWSSSRTDLLVNSNDGVLTIIDINTLAKTPVALDSLEVFDAQWSADGKQITYTATTSLQADNAEVWIANIDGTEKRKVTNNTSVALAPAWNAKHKSILFSAGTPGKNQELWEVLPETGKNEQLTISKFSSLDPDVNSAGEIIYSSDQGGFYTIWRLDEKLNRQQLTKTTGYDAQPSWSQDGKSFAFFRIISGKKQIWVHSIVSGEEYPITPENVLSRSPAWIE